MTGRVEKTLISYLSRRKESKTTIYSAIEEFFNTP